MRSCPVSPLVISALSPKSRPIVTGITTAVLSLFAMATLKPSERNNRALTGTIKVGAPLFIFRCTCV